MLIDIRFDLISFFLVWAALILTCVTTVAFVLGSPRRRVQVSGVTTLALWVAGALVPALS